MNDPDMEGAVARGAERADQSTEMRLYKGLGDHILNVATGGFYKVAKDALGEDLKAKIRAIEEEIGKFSEELGERAEADEETRRLIDRLGLEARQQSRQKVRLLARFVQNATKAQGDFAEEYRERCFDLIARMRTCHLDVLREISDGAESLYERLSGRHTQSQAESLIADLYAARLVDGLAVSNGGISLNPEHLSLSAEGARILVFLSDPRVAAD